MPTNSQLLVTIPLWQNPLAKLELGRLGGAKSCLVCARGVVDQA